MIITKTTKPHAVCIHNLGAHMRKTDPGFNSPELAFTVLEIAKQNGGGAEWAELL